MLSFVGRPSKTHWQVSLEPGLLALCSRLTDEACRLALAARTHRCSYGLFASSTLVRTVHGRDDLTEVLLLATRQLPKAADAYGSFFPMMTTAAGTIRPAKVLVLGAGIGITGNWTAKRLGAVVTAYDVRPAAKSEVESLGAKFLDLDVDLTKGQGDGGYARELTVEERAAQQAQLIGKAADFDVIITTAQVPGRKPPMLLTSAGVNGLKRGAVIVDCAASEFGGNVEGSVVRERVITESGVTIIGDPDLASGVPVTASQQIARNLADTLVTSCTKRKPKALQPCLTVDMNDEIDAAMVVAGG